MNNLLLKWKELSEIRDKLNQKVIVSKECYSLKLSNDPSLLLISSKNQTCEEEFVVINVLGENIFPESDQPSSECMLHTSIYQQLNVNCVLQIQTVHNTIVSELFSKKSEISFQQLDKVIPIAENENEVLNFISEYDAVCIQNKGIVAWGKNVVEVSKMIQLIEFQCECHIKTLMLDVKRSVI